MQGRTYRYMEQEALYPFGYGLSYTEYAYQNVRFLEQEPVVSEGVTIGLSVKNTGKMDGTETAQRIIIDLKDKIVSLGIADELPASGGNVVMVRQHRQPLRISMCVTKRLGRILRKTARCSPTWSFDSYSM